MGELKSQGKPFEISKGLVWKAYLRVKANRGAPGVDGCSIEDFETDLKNNLYRIWNRMSSGSYFPPPVKAVEIPKSHGGVRILGVPTVADRVAQTVVAMELEKRVEPMFHRDSYGRAHVLREDRRRGHRRARRTAAPLWGRALHRDARERRLGDAATERPATDDGDRPLVHVGGNGVGHGLHVLPPLRLVQIGARIAGPRSLTASGVRSSPIARRWRGWCARLRGAAGDV